MAPCRFLFRSVIAAALVLSLVGCGPSREQVRREAGDARKLGEAYLRSGNPTAALKEFLKAEENDPESYILQNDLGLAYMAKNRIELAIPHFRRAIELKPDYAPAKNNLGYAYLRNEQLDEAIEAFTAVSEDLLYATPHFPLAGLGAAHYQKGQFDIAQGYYLKSLEINPRYPSALWGLGRTQVALGNVPEGIQNLERAVAQAPNFSEAWFDLGQAYRRDGRNDKALEAFRKVKTLAADTPLGESAGEEMKTLQP